MFWDDEVGCVYVRRCGVTYDQAVTYCNDMGATLFSPDDDFEFDELRNYLNRTGNFFSNRLWPTHTHVQEMI